MKQWPIAIQVYSVREQAEQDFAGTMRALKEMGYDGVELAGTYGMSAVEVKAILDEIGLELVSAHVGPDLLEQEEILADYAATGMKYIVIPWFPAPKDEKELENAVAKIRGIAERCRAHGMQLLYHNHDFELETVGGRCILDAYYEDIPADLLQTELDMCWVNVGGKEPAAYLRKYSGRAPVVHLKDFTGSKSANMYGLIDSKDSQTGAPTTFEFRPVGYGRQEIPELVKAAEDAGSHWLIVEQDEPGMGFSCMRCAEMSVRYLRSFL